MFPTVEKKIDSSEAYGRLLGYFDALSSFQKDPDGAPVDSDAYLFGILTGSDNDTSSYTLSRLRTECWRQFKTNPFVGTATRDSVDSFVGDGFSIRSKVQEINDVLEKEFFDYRNKLWTRMRQVVTAYEVTGESFLCLTCDPYDRFVHIDMIHSNQIDGVDASGNGIIFHPEKTHMPLFYHVRRNNDSNEYDLIPSIYMAMNPNMVTVAENHPAFDKNKIRSSLMTQKQNPRWDFEQFGGFRRFVVERESDIVCQRNISHLWSVLIWSNFYTLMKSVEIDHKRALASFCWVMQPNDESAWEVWNKLTPQEQARTGLLGPKPPGSTLIPPFGFDVKAIAPQLPNITGSDNDLREMLVAGLQQPADVITGNPEGKNFGSVKASRGPWSDRVLNQQSYFKAWTIHDLCRSILFIYNKLYGMSDKFSFKEVVRYENKEPISEVIVRPAWQFVNVNVPVFSSGNLSDLRSFYLGSKPAGLVDVLGISQETVSRKLGISDYHEERLKRETEKLHYPSTMPKDMSGEQLQEAQLAMPSE